MNRQRLLLRQSSKLGFPSPAAVLVPRLRHTACAAPKQEPVSHEVVFVANGRDLPELQLLEERPAEQAASSAPRAGTEGPTGGGDDQDDFRLNFGHAVRVLRDDLPSIFSQPPQADIYHPGLQFEAPWLQFQGVSKYLWAQTIMRAVCRVLFSQVELELARLWSPSPGLLRARCRVLATPWGSNLVLSVIQLQHRLTSTPAPEYTTAQWQLDLLFTYHFSSKGFVSRHTVQRVLPLDPPLAAAVRPAEAAWSLRAGSPVSRVPPN